MKTTAMSVPIHLSGRERFIILLRENRKIVIQFILTALFLYMAAWFISHERAEIINVRNILVSANAYWVIAAIGLVIVYIMLRGLMYVTSFSSINVRISLKDCIILFLKRNFISVFLPAGGVSSLVFFTSSIEKQGIKKSQLLFASSINAFTGILTVLIVAVPAFLFVVTGSVGVGKWLALGGVVLILSFFVLAFYSLIRKSPLYRWAIKMFPGWQVVIEDMSNHRIKMIPFIQTVLVSVFVEIIGIAHVYISMVALGVEPSLSLSVIAYIVALVFIVISPFLRGLGAIEVSMSYILTQYGLGNAEAIAVTMLFRFFEFWLPLLAGILSFLLKLEKLFLRILPAVLIFSLGIVNIVSVLLPALPGRVKLLSDFLMLNVISFSNMFVFVAGLFLLLTAAFMLKGLRSSWWIALGLSFLSMIGHLTKGIDYEEAILALLVIISLAATRKEYYVKPNPRLSSFGLLTAFLSIASVMLFGVLGFYLLDQQHFRIDFNLRQSVNYTLQNYFLLGSPDLVPYDQFARDFLNLIKISGFGTMALLVYAVARPYIFRAEPSAEEKERAEFLVHKYGRSSLDYFKTYYDKMLFVPEGINAFISYRISKNFAVVLEDPVSENIDEMKKCIAAFKKFCYDNGLKDIYYRVPEESLQIYAGFSAKNLFIGQEAILDLETFSLAGGDKKPIRNALNKIKAEGYITRVNTPPLRDGLIQKLKAVSDDWLRQTERHELVFSQGVFDEKEIKNQTVITIENKEEMVIAFLNIIPDYAANEGTYDLQRKTTNAPNGIMDHLLVEMYDYFRKAGIRYVNLGFAPMSGVNDPHNFPERSMKFAYEKIRSFAHYKGMRDYKDKFGPAWKDKYLIYSNDYDLLQIPSALNRVIKV
ncbi:MAG TPA: phosphatidylglycerol lysyltransferase domain-containing protein [Bacteroidales bacterium]|nr:phosphatidylglycerol lysyltransferase domain-containing protein [Bacteroidales bacterium]